MIFEILDTKSFKFDDIVPRVSGWQTQISQGIKRLLPIVFILTGHPINRPFEECTPGEEGIR
jgi:hypothetical protein